MIKILLLYCLYIIITLVMVKVTKISLYKEFIIPIYLTNKRISLSFTNVGKGKYRWEINIFNK